MGRPAQLAHRRGQPAVIFLRPAARLDLDRHPHLARARRRRHQNHRPVHAGAGAVEFQIPLVAVDGSLRTAVTTSWTQTRLDPGGTDNAGVAYVRVERRGDTARCHLDNRHTRACHRVCLGDTRHRDRRLCRRNLAAKRTRYRRRCAHGALSRGVFCRRRINDYLGRIMVVAVRIRADRPLVPADAGRHAVRAALGH